MLEQKASRERCASSGVLAAMVRHQRPEAKRTEDTSPCDRPGLGRRRSGTGPWCLATAAKEGCMSHVPGTITVAGRSVLHTSPSVEAPQHPVHGFDQMGLVGLFGRYAVHLARVRQRAQEDVGRRNQGRTTALGPVP